MKRFAKEIGSTASSSLRVRRKQMLQLRIWTGRRYGAGSSKSKFQTVLLAKPLDHQSGQSRLLVVDFGIPLILDHLDRLEESSSKWKISKARGTSAKAFQSTVGGFGDEHPLRMLVPQLILHTTTKASTLFVLLVPSRLKRLFVSPLMSM